MVIVMVLLYVWIIAAIIDTLFDINLDGERVFIELGLPLDDVRYLRFGYIVPIINLILLWFYIDTYSYFKQGKENKE